MPTKRKDTKTPGRKKTQCSNMSTTPVWSAQCCETPWRQVEKIPRRRAFYVARSNYV
jgi:hypothetical protein